MTSTRRTPETARHFPFAATQGSTTFSLLTCLLMPAGFQHLFSGGYRTPREGDAAHSRVIFLNAVRKAAEERDEPSLAEALCGLAQSERDIGNCEAALHHYANATVLYRRIGPPIRLAYALRHEADIRRTSGKPTEAETLFQEAETIYREAGEDHTLDLANTLRGLALTRQATGDSAAARPLWQQARTLYVKLNVQAGVQQCDAALEPG